MGCKVYHGTQGYLVEIIPRMEASCGDDRLEVSKASSMSSITIADERIHLYVRVISTH